MAPWWCWGVGAGLGATLLLAPRHYFAPLQQTMASLSTGGAGSAALWTNSIESVADVQSLCTSLGFEEQFTALRHHSFTSLPAIIAAEAPPKGRWIKPLHWYRLRAAAKAQMAARSIVDGTKELKDSAVTERDDLASTPVALVPPPPVRETVCASWANSEALRRAWAAGQKSPSGRSRGAGGGSEPPLPPVDACSTTADRREPRDLPQPHVGSASFASAVSAKSGWWRNQLTPGHVEALRARGVVDHLVVDTARKLAFCAVPGAGGTSLRAWLLRQHGLWRGVPRPGPHLRGNGSAVFAQPPLVAGHRLSDEKLMEVLNGGEYFKFTFVADPFLRTLSTYTARFADCARRRAPAECALWARALLGDSRPPHSLSFEGYLRAARQQLRRRISYQAAHWLPSSSVCGVDRIAYDFIGRIDANDTDTQLLYDVVGFQGMTRAQRVLLGEAGDAMPIQHYGASEEGVMATLRVAATVYRDDMTFLGYSGGNLLGVMVRIKEQLQAQKPAAPPRVIDTVVAEDAGEKPAA